MFSIESARKVQHSRYKIVQKQIVSNSGNVSKYMKALESLLHTD